MPVLYLGKIKAGHLVPGVPPSVYKHVFCLYHLYRLQIQDSLIRNILLYTQ